MTLREDQVRLQGLLKEAITLLGTNGLQFHNEFSVETLIGTTIDSEPELDASISKESR